MNIKKIIKQNPVLFKFTKLLLLYFRFINSIFKKDCDYESFPQLHLNEVLEIRESGYHCFFGYYDKSPVNESGTRILYLRVRTKIKSIENADICIYNINDKSRTVVATTNSWNWQQGCMLQWIDDNTISYNLFQFGKYHTVLLNIVDKSKRLFERPSYSFNSNYTHFLSLNFYRLDLYAKGYGYRFMVDSLQDQEDGIWETAISNNETNLILSFSEIINYRSSSYNFSHKNIQHYVNHITYCPDENLILFIHRWQEPGEAFSSRLMVYDKNDKTMRLLLDNKHVSHYCWKNDSELLIYATNVFFKKGYMVINIYTGSSTIIDELPKEDGHPSYSNEKNWILTDTYPNHRRNQYLFLYNTIEKKMFVVDKLHSPIKYFNENRCDLHPRWSYDNKHIVIDNTDMGFRTMKIYRFTNSFVK
jgi:hypothetical protein